jgi:hypothetical protein
MGAKLAGGAELSWGGWQDRARCLSVQIVILLAVYREAAAKGRGQGKPAAAAANTTTGRHANAKNHNMLCQCGPVRQGQSDKLTQPSQARQETLTR